MGILEVNLNEDGRSIRFSNVFLFKFSKIDRRLVHAVDGLPLNFTVGSTCA